MTVPPTFRPESSEKFEPLTINVAKFRVMLKERVIEAESAASKVAAVQNRLKKLAESGGSLSAAQVAENLNIARNFFVLEGRVQQLRELLADFDALLDQNQRGSMRPPHPTASKSPKKQEGFRLG